MTGDLLRHHLAAHRDVSDCPLLDGNAVRLLEGGAATLHAVLDLVGSARSEVLMEYYTLQDVHSDGRSLVDALLRKLAEGVRVRILYDAIGSIDTDEALFDRLRGAGASVIQYAPVNPLRARFNWRVNDRDHRKLLVVDGQEALLGGVNMSRVYENPPSAGAPPDARQAFWYDAAAHLRGPCVRELGRLWRHVWAGQGGAAIEPPPPVPPQPDGECVRVAGSAPREHRQLYYASLHAAVQAARSHVLLATGYFVPTHAEWRMLARAARRGVRVELLLAGYTDVRGCLAAARALYGRLLKRGVRIHEMRAGLLHAKVATIDGVWTAIGSSNLDRRSFDLNNELDAVVLGPATAGAVEAMLRGWTAQAVPVTYAEWRRRPLRAKAGEWLVRLWERYM